MPVKTKEAKARKYAYMKAYGETHKEELRVYRREWSRQRLSTPDGRVAQLLRSAKRRAKGSGREFDITIEDIEIPTRCPLLGIELDYGNKRGTPSPNSPSIDRIDSNKGYIKGNVWIVSWRANSLKNNAEMWELELIVKGLKEKLCPTPTASQQPPS